MSSSAKMMISLCASSMPRFLATLITMPVLAVYSDVLGWMGGAVVAALNPRIHVGFRAYFQNLEKIVEMSDVLGGLFKAMVFGIVISIICCYVGLKTTGGPREIGRSVTRALVLSFVFIIVFDYILTRLLL